MSLWLIAKLLLFITLCSKLIYSSNEHCTWTYRCCEFKDNNGKIECLKMCEAQINCNSSVEMTSSEVEKIEASHPKPLDLTILRRNCKAGYKFIKGKCRTIMRLQDVHGNLI